MQNRTHRLILLTRSTESRRLLYYIRCIQLQLKQEQVHIDLQERRMKHYKILMIIFSLYSTNGIKDLPYYSNPKYLPGDQPIRNCATE